MQPPHVLCSPVSWLTLAKTSEKGHFSLVRKEISALPQTLQRILNIPSSGRLRLNKTELTLLKYIVNVKTDHLLFLGKLKDRLVAHI